MDILEVNKEQEQELVATEANAVSEQQEVIAEAKVEPETVVAEENMVSESEAVANEQPAENDFLGSLSKSELVGKLQTLVEQTSTEAKTEVNSIKQWFYKKLKAEAEEAKKLWVEAGNKLEDFLPVADEWEAKAKDLLTRFREKHAKTLAQVEEEKAKNLKRKEEILEKLRELTDNIDNIGEAFPKFRELQQEWKAVGAIPAGAVADTWKNYQLYVEKFYDYVKINNELRDYDLKKNLETKNSLIEQAEKLTAEPDVVSAFRQLQRLHDEWRESGPVAKELREEVWTRFKQASTAVNKRHSDHFEAIHQQEEANLAEKTRICEELDAINAAEITAFKEWEEKSARVLELQAEWRKTGFAPKKVNQEIYDRYRAATNLFFSHKSDYYRDVKDTQSRNLKLKIALCEKAEALKESEEWREASEAFVKMQNEWKTIGAVSRRYSDEIWKRFIAACDHFFEQKAKATGNVKHEQEQNLKAKQEIIERIAQLQPAATTGESTVALKSLIAEFNAVGHVPFKSKDKIYKEFRAAVDKQFDQLNVDISNRRLDYYKANVVEDASASPDKLRRELDKLTRQREQLKAEIATSENNIQVFYARSNKANPLKAEMERKVAKLKDELVLLDKKISLLKSTESQG